MRSLLFWGLFPFLLPQAYFVRKSALRFEGAKGDTTGATGRGAKFRLAAIGDSIIAGVGASTLDKALVGQTASALAASLPAEIEWSVFGKTGVTSREVLETLVPDLPPVAFDFIVVSVGVNDITSLRTRKSFERSLHRIIDDLERHSPTAVIAVAGIPPLGEFPLLPQPLRALLGLRGGSFDEVIQRVVARHARAAHVPVRFDFRPGRFSADGFHPSEDSYADYGAAMASQLIAHRRALQMGEAKDVSDGGREDEEDERKRSGFPPVD